MVLFSQLDIIFETSQDNGHDRHYLITGMVAMAQQVWQPVIAVLQLNKKKILPITLLQLHVNFPNGINTSVSIYLSKSTLLGKE